MRKNIIAALVAAVILPAAMHGQGQIAFNYNTSNGDIFYTGLEAPGTYDIAIRVYGSKYIGNKIVGMEVPVPFKDSDVTDATAWISTELALATTGENNPNVTSQSATIADGVLKVTFDEPYTMTSTGAYIGYTFTIPAVIDEGTAYPIAIGPYTSNAGFFLHTAASTNYIRWSNVSSAVEGNVPMTVYLEGDYPQLAIEASAGSPFFTIAGEMRPVGVTVKNVGAEAVNTIDYTTTIGELSVSGTSAVSTPIVNYGSSRVFLVNTPVCTEPKPTAAKIEITAVNGTQLETPVTVESDLSVLAFETTRLPLVEEYTGLWCGYCPRGFVALEEMNEAYGQEFVALAYHDSDDLQTMSALKPNTPPGYPYSYIDRSWGNDPSYIPSVWPEYRQLFTPANLSVDLAWTDDTHQSVVATSTVNFAYNIDNANYRLSMVLVGDEFYHEDLTQHNYFSGMTAPEGSKLWEMFTKSGEWVSGLKFNDVVFANPNIRGETNSVPATVTYTEPITYSKTFDLNNVKCTYSGGDVFERNEGIAQYAGKLHAVVILIDGSNNSVVNCAKSLQIDNDFEPAGIGSIEADSPLATVVATTYLDLQGRQVDTPAAGQLYIKRELMSDGTYRHTKQIVK